jgi:hypothetical protein
MTSKKAQLDVLRAARDTLIGGVLVLILFAIIWNFLISPGSTRVGTAYSFAEFSDVLATVAVTGDADAVALDVQDNRIIVGFDAVTPVVFDSCNEQRIHRPPECSFDACVCLCDESSFCDDFRDCTFLKDTTYVYAREFPSGYGAPRAVNKKQGNQVVLYGDCGAGKPSFGTTTVHVEKDEDALIVFTLDDPPQEKPEYDIGSAAHGGG